MNWNIFLLLSLLRIEQFQEEHFISFKIIFLNFRDRLLPMLGEWTEELRRYGYLGIQSLLQLAQDYSTKYVPQIITRLSNSIRDIRDDGENALQTAAILASYVEPQNILESLVPYISNEGPIQIIKLLEVFVLNGNLNDGELDAILNALLESHAYEALDSIENLVGIVLSMVKKSQSFAETISTDRILKLILKLCENSDAIKVFETAFTRPLSEIFAQHLNILLLATEKTPKFLSHLLLTIPYESVLTNQIPVLETLTNMITNGDLETQAETFVLIQKLCKISAFQSIPDEPIQIIIEHVTWRAGKEFIPMRNAATLAVGEMLKSKAIADEVLGRLDVIEKILTSVDDDWSELIRTSGVYSLQQYVQCDFPVSKDFEKIFAALRKILDDPNHKHPFNGGEWIFKFSSKMYWY